MNVDTMILIANSFYITEELQFQLWESNELQVRRALVKRGDLSYKISLMAVADSDLIASWASVPRKDNKLLNTAIKNAIDDMALISLSSQDLEKKDAILLAKKCNNIIGWFLYEKKKKILPDRYRKILITNYIEKHEYIQDTPGKNFIEVIGNDIVAWKSVIKAVNTNTIPFLNTVYNQLELDKSIASDILNKIEELLYNNISERSEKILERILVDYSTKQFDDKNLYNNIESLAKIYFPKKYQEILENIKISNILIKKFCKNLYFECKDKKCIKLLKIIATYPGYLNNTNEEFPLALLNHYNSLSEAEEKKLFNDLRNPIIKKTLDNLIKHKLSLKAAKLIMSTNCYIDEKDLTIDIYKELFILNPKKAIGFNFPDKYIPNLINFCQPLKYICLNERLLGYFIKEISLLDYQSRNTAINLIDQWEGSYEDLKNMLYKL